MLADGSCSQGEAFTDPQMPGWEDICLPWASLARRESHRSTMLFSNGGHWWMLREELELDTQLGYFS